MIDELYTGLEGLGAGSFGVFWAPMAIWSLMVLVTASLERMGVRPSPAIHLDLSRALFLALPAGILLGMARMLFAATISVGAGDAAGFASGLTLPLLSVFPESAVARWPGSTGWVVLGLVTIAAFGAAAPAILRLLRAHMAASRLVASLPEVLDPDVLRILDETKQKLGIHSRVRLLEGGSERAPLVVGILRPAIVVPKVLLGQESRLKMVLCHELAHVRSRDTMYDALERLCCALFVCNPLVDSLSRRIHVLREMRCDAVVLSVHRAPVRAYAELLWDYAEAGPSAAGLGSFSSMAGPSSQLKQRVLEMKHASSSFSARQARLAVVLGGLLFVLAAFLVGCTDVGTVDRDAEVSAQATEAVEAEVFTTVDQMPEIEGGIIPALSGVIRYPESARADGTEGRVMVEFVVDERGTVVSAQVLQGVREDLDAEAVRAVKSLEFTPGRHDGKAVSVKLVVPIQFRLG